MIAATLVRRDAETALRYSGMLASDEEAADDGRRSALALGGKRIRVSSARLQRNYSAMRARRNGRRMDIAVIRPGSGCAYSTCGEYRERFRIIWSQQVVSPEETS
jgi:hypothetical protein